MRRRCLDVGQQMVPGRIEALAHQLGRQAGSPRPLLQLELARPEQQPARVAQVDELVQEPEQQQLEVRVRQLDAVALGRTQPFALLDGGVQQRLGRGGEDVSQRGAARLETEIAGDIVRKVMVEIPAPAPT